ncbi:MAG: hypothetical protein ACI4U2_00150 [Christensenellaceae bacterium]
MKYIVDTLKYVIKNILYLILLAVVPALVFVLCFDYAGYAAFVKGFFTGQLVTFSFADFFRAFSILNVSHWYYVLGGIVGFFVIAIFLSVMLALIEKHMRIGKRTLNGIFSKLNDNIVATATACFVCFLIWEAFSLAIAVLGVALNSLFTNAPVAAYIFFSVVVIGFIYLAVLCISKFALWIPCQLITGFGMYEALNYSAHLQQTRQVHISLLLPLVVGNVILAVCAFGGTFALAPVVFVVYLIYFLYFGSFMEVVYFDEEQMEREDLKPAYRRR